MPTQNPIQLERVLINNEAYFKISNSDQLRPFFMSIVSDANHWMFISSNGGLSSGRKNSEYALFPYYTDDKITESAEITGSKSLFRVQKEGQLLLWEPFSLRQQGRFRTTQNLYKNTYGNKIVFEEVNEDIGLTFRYQWSSSKQYGFVKTSTLLNHSNTSLQIDVLDGLQNILPFGVPSDLQNRSSNLVDAYKRSELIESCGLGVFALSAIIVDKAEPSEALKANVVWSMGLNKPTILLSSRQLDAFRKGEKLIQENDVKAEKGAFFVNTEIHLDAASEQTWMCIANVNHDHVAIAALTYQIEKDKGLAQSIQEDVEDGTQQLLRLVAAADGIQKTSDSLRNTRHFSNTLFNIMRGGIFDDGYTIEKWDFERYLKNANTPCYQRLTERLKTLPEKFSYLDIEQWAAQSNDKDLERLSTEYLPLKFSRRHGDPSRPWNRFSINTQNEEDGSKILDYEGNWRDIFQNWEALAHSYPQFIEGMIFKFLNASTFDGYNPYRVTKDGFDWEVIEPEDPWSYIGYWGDHQIIYLLKFLEFQYSHEPESLERYFTQDVFVYANVPYRIKDYDSLLKNPKDTIDFDGQGDHAIRERRKRIGADGALVTNAQQHIHRVNYIEKILATVLAKISNFIPEGGIWMNTQRPEWNDANNALVGNGVSMVTLYYLRRFLKFFETVFENTNIKEVSLSEELLEFFRAVRQTLVNHHGLLSGSIDDVARKTVLDGLARPASDYRLQIYENGFTGKMANLTIIELKEFVRLGLDFLEHSIRANKRADGLYHAYNLMTVKSGNRVTIDYLSEMLEGQVAVLSSGYLSAKETLATLNALKASALFREDQYSYLLYPNKKLPLFMQRNQIPKASVEGSPLLTQLLANGHTGIVRKDVQGAYHFNGNFKNARDLEKALDQLGAPYQQLLAKDKTGVLQIFEDIFNHKAFTGRSGTFFGYEGLGSIYWHMVSKLLLAVQECSATAIDQQTDQQTVGHLLEHFYEIMEGIGVHKSPELYGAFPTDPYSHTPSGKGAQQPGMTGQVKEDILSRFGELGILVKEGQLGFNPSLLRKSEFLEQQEEFAYITVHNASEQLTLPAGTLAFTYCQVPMVYHLAQNERIVTTFADARPSVATEGLLLDPSTSSEIFKRTGSVSKLDVYVNPKRLK